MFSELSLTLPIHARITYTFSWVYFEQIEQIRQEQDKIKSHGTVEINDIKGKSIVGGLCKIHLPPHICYVLRRHVENAVWQMFL